MLMCQGIDTDKEYCGISQYRSEKTKKLRNESDIKLSLGAELLLIEALKRYYPRVRIPFEIETDRYGKPYIKGESSIHFSLAHSGAVAVCAISDRAVGADVERKSRVSEKIRNRYFTNKEKNYEFCYIWTRKEALLKAEGIGITAGLDTFDVSESTVIFNGNKYTLITFEPKISDYCISLALS